MFGRKGLTLSVGIQNDRQISKRREIWISYLSITSNSAEGFARQHTKEHQQFCCIALGSCVELETQWIIAQRRNYVSSEDFSGLEDYSDHESRMLMNLIKSLRG